MPRINDALTQRGKRRIRKAELPTWWGLFMGALGVLLLLWIAWSLISGDSDSSTGGGSVSTIQYTIATVPIAENNTTTSQPGTTQPGTQDTVQTPTTFENATTTEPAPIQTTPGAPDVAIPAAGGGTATIPAGAFNAAAGAATIAAGPDSKIGNITYRAADGENLYIDVTIDPDGDGAAAETIIHYRCQQTDGIWTAVAA